MLGQDDGLLRRAAGRGRGRRGGDLPRQLLVGQLCREREVERAQLVVGGDAGKLDVERVPLAGGRALRGRGGEQGVRCAHVVPVHDEQPGLDGVVDGLSRR